MVQTRSMRASRSATEDPKRFTRSSFQVEDRPGKPGAVCRLNLDVLFLIAQQVRPVDLLHLACTCTSLRRLLMGSVAAFVWKTARGQVQGLPDCPADLTEQQYAHLAFCDNCHACGLPATTVLWEIRRRYCRDCKIRRLRVLSTSHKVIRKNDVLAAERIMRKRKWMVCVDRKQMESFMREYGASSEREQFIKDREALRAAIRDHARQCKEWRVHEQQRCREERERMIIERLKQLGYGPEINHFGSFEIKTSCKSLFTRSQPLAEKGRLSLVDMSCAQANH